MKIHDLPGDTATAYDLSQTDDSISDGDVLIVREEGVVGFLLEAWPVAVTERHGEFHAFEAGIDPTTVDGGKYAASYRKALEIAATL